jgi:hypothetical protein
MTMTLVEEYERQRELERLRIAWDAQSEAREALVGILFAAGGTIRVSHADLLRAGELLVSDDAATGDRIYTVRPERV